MLPNTELLSVPLQSNGGGGALGLVFLLAVLVLSLVSLAGMCLAFRKANEPWWAPIIPIYNVYVTLRIGGNKWWWLLVMLIPIVNIYAIYKMFAGVSNAFGKGIGFTLGLFFLSFIFWPLLGFGDYDYQGVPGQRAGTRV